MLLNCFLLEIVSQPSTGDLICMYFKFLFSNSICSIWNSLLCALGSKNLAAPDLENALQTIWLGGCFVFETVYLSKNPLLRGFLWFFGFLSFFFSVVEYIDQQT